MPVAVHRQLRPEIAVCAYEDVVSVWMRPALECPNVVNTQAVFADFEFDGLVVQFFFCEFGCNLWNAHMNNSDSEKRGEWPNDPKLSDGGAWRSLCRWGERRWRSVAQAVTRGAVRCSAWLGVRVFTRDERMKMLGPLIGWEMAAVIAWHPEIDATATRKLLRHLVERAPKEPPPLRRVASGEDAPRGNA